MTGRIALPVAAGLATAAATAALTGVPTDVIENPWFTRMTPVTWWAVPALIVTSVLAGILVGLAVAERASGRCAVRNTTVLGGGGVGLGWLAIGCPVCNKVIVAVLGMAGAMSWFAPIQPVLAIGAPLLLGVAVLLRVRGLVAGRRQGPSAPAGPGGEAAVQAATGP